MNKYRPLPQLSQGFLSSQRDFVLLQTGRADSENTRSYLFRSPVDVLVARDFNEVPDVIRAVGEMSASHYLAGFFSYELGYHFEDRLGPSARAPEPLVWLGVYDRALVFDHQSGEFSGPTDGAFSSEEDGRPSYEVSGLGLEMPEDEYVRRIAQIKEYIAAGDIYQANFTTAYTFSFEGSPYGLYLDLMGKQDVSYNAFIRAGDMHVLSISPELFLRKEGGRVTTRPMKGTAPRGRTAQEDEAQAAFLHYDVKNRSENVMIVDLMRNDLGRISRTGTVSVPELFTVERYQTLYQMTSTVTAELEKGSGIVELLRSAFPSGSVTGAPKIRAMQIIRELEASPRGVYTGAVGFIAPGGDCVFNIPIRTVTIRGGAGRMGVGSGIVADSGPEAEYAECRLKAEFLVKEFREFKLIETMLWDGSFGRLELHLGRLEASARYFQFPFDREAVAARLRYEEGNMKTGQRYRVHLLLYRQGRAEVSIDEMGDEPEGEITVAVSSNRTSSTDVFLFHKTTNRGLYDEEFSRATGEGHADVLFLNERGEVTEGAISNVFMEKDERFFTPPVTCGLLDGVFRRQFLATHPEAEERVLTLEDLKRADAVYIANSVRGMRRVSLKGM